MLLVIYHYYLACNLQVINISKESIYSTLLVLFPYVFKPRVLGFHLKVILNSYMREGGKP